MSNLLWAIVTYAYFTIAEGELSRRPPRRNGCTFASLRLGTSFRYPNFSILSLGKQHDLPTWIWQESYLDRQSDSASESRSQEGLYEHLCSEVCVGVGVHARMISWWASVGLIWWRPVAFGLPISRDGAQRAPSNLIFIAARGTFRGRTFHLRLRTGQPWAQNAAERRCIHVNESR